MEHSTLGSRRVRLAMTLALVALGGAAAGCSSGNSNGGGDNTDRTAPTVSIDAATLAASLSRTVTITATASDNVGVADVEFRVDGSAIGTDNTAPYSVQWNTGAAQDGARTLTAVARDAQGNTTISAPVSVTVANVRQFAVTLSGHEESPANASSGAGTANLTVNLATGATSGAVTVTGFTSNAAHIHDGFAGVNGPVVIGFEQDAANAQRWAAPAGASLTSAQVDRLLAGALYLNVHSAQFPGGEVRGQILPPNLSLLFTDLSGLHEVPEVATLARGRAALTLNSASRTVTIYINTQGVDDANAAHLHRGVAGTNGPVVVGLTKDASVATRWFVENAGVPQADFDALLAAGTYVNVHTPANAGGEIRGQVVPAGFAVIVSRLNGEQEAAAPRITAAHGTGAITVHATSGATEVHLNVTGADDANAAHVHDGFAGANGPVIVALEKDPAAATHWRSNGATLTSAQIATLNDGGLYANVHTPAAPEGLIRGQLLLAGVELVISHLNGAQEAPDPVTTNATARASTTVNAAAKRLTINVHTTGLDDATLAHIHRGARGVAGPVVFELTKDATTPSQWSASVASFTDAQLQDYRDGLWYVNVHTPANQPGEVRGQIELGGVAPLRYEEIQARAFNATCATSGCHAGAAPQAGLDLAAPGSHGKLVGVASSEVNTLLRVAPGDAPASYLARKLEGGPNIVGVRMPNGLPPLPQETIDRLKAWVNAGALPAPTPAPADTEAPVVTLGTVAATLSGTVTFTATATDNVGVTLVRWRVNGNVVGSDATAPYSFDWNSTGVANGAVTIDAQAPDAAGNVGTSATASATVSNTTGPTPFTFTEIQTQIFNVSCAVSGCHAGPAPAAGMDLTASAFTRIVNVPSSEVSGLMRVAPGNASDSYLIRKLEGGPGIVGARMPLGGPFLNQATIDRIRAWIDSGAPNN
jgi:hypothetical protein